MQRSAIPFISDYKLLYITKYDFSLLVSFNSTLTVSKTTRLVELDAHNSSAKCIASSYIIIDRLLAVSKESSVLLLSLDDLALNYFWFYKMLLYFTLFFLKPLYIFIFFFHSPLSKKPCKQLLQIIYKQNRLYQW